MAADRFLLLTLFLEQVTGQTPSLTGPTSGVLGSSIHLICTLPGSSSLVLGLPFNRAGETGAQCVVNSPTCSQFRAEDSYSCACVSGETRQFYLNISALRVQDDDAWTCSYNGVDSNRISLSVYYAPQINSTFPSSRPVTEFSRLQIDCSSYTTPGNPPTTSYTWTYGGSTVSSGAVLYINNIGRDRRGQYTCTASNTVGSSGANVTVDVHYAPKIESTFPSNRPVTEFSRLQIDCSSYTTPGNPPTTSYTWTYGGSTVSSGTVLYINNIGRDRRGQYTCTASNTVGSSDANVTVDVQYLDRPDLTLDKTEVVENETVSLTCNVESNPTAELEIRNVDNDTVLVERDTNILEFTIDRVQCLHNGSFLCSARNTQTGDVSTSSRKELNVLCAPSINNRHPSITDVTRGLGDVASFTVNVLANPSPLFDWYLRKNEQLVSIPASTEHTIVSSKQTSVLQLQLNNTGDYGTYAVVVRNSIGSLQMTFTVSPIPPDSGLQEPDRLGLGVGIGVSVMIPVIIVILCIWLLLHRRETHHHKSTGNETIELPVQESTVTGEHRVYTELTVAESTVNEYEQLQIPQGQSQDYQNA